MKIEIDEEYSAAQKNAKITLQCSSYFIHLIKEYLHGI